jgi:hypothetical protein
MTTKEQREIRQLADDALSLIRVARGVTRDLADQFARPTQPAALGDLLTRNLQAHTSAWEKSNQLAAAIKTAKVTAWETSAEILLEKTTLAKEKAAQLKTCMQVAPPNQQAIAAALREAFDAADEAANRMVDFRSAIEKSEENPGKQTAWATLLSSMKENAGTLIAVVGTFILAAIVIAVLILILWVLMGGGKFLTQISQIETARGLITFLVCLATVGIALMLVLGGLLLNGENKEDREKRFSQGKDVLTVLVGILGTILGFYFASDQSTRNASANAAAMTNVAAMNVAPVLLARVPGGTTVTMGTSITGGKPPYTYSVSLTDGTVLIKDEKNSDGRILQFLTNAPASKTATLSVQDSSTNRQEMKFEIK